MLNGKKRIAICAEVARLLKAQREQKQLSMTALAAKAGLSQQMVSYVERGIRLWDIAAGILLVESAGGSVKLETRPDHPDKFSVVATNGLLPL